jgi:hypothetical protein
MSSGTEQFAGMAKRLQELVGQFKLTSAGAGVPTVARVPRAVA